MGKNQIILFDGVCHLCDGFVKWVIRNDPDGQFKFAPQQSKYSREIIKQFNGNIDDVDSILLYDGERVLSRSSAFFEIIRSLDSPVSILQVFAILPRTFTDMIYRLVAKYRYKWFGKSEHCMLVNGELRSRFLH